MQRKIFLVAAFLLCALTLVVTVGCQKKAEPVQISWYMIGNGPQKDVDKVQAAVDKYIQSKGVNATVKLVCFDWGAYDNKMQTIIASGEPFDICFTAVWTNNYRNNAGRGAFVPLNDLLTKYAPKTKAALGADFLAGSAIDGVNYAIPANKEKAHNWGFIIRSDLVKKYNMDLSTVKKLEDLEPLLKQIKAGDKIKFDAESSEDGFTVTRIQKSGK